MSAQPIPVTIAGEVVALFGDAAQIFRPPTRVTITGWAERERIISKESGAFGGRYRAALAPYQRGMQDAVLIPGVKEVVYFLPAQMGKSVCMENIFGYFVDEDPSSIIWMWPTDKVAKEWSDDTLEPLIRDSPVLAAKFDEGSRKKSNRALAKRFPGGWLAIIGANSPAGLRRRRARVILADEIDGYPNSAGDEGDPIELVAARSETFWARIRIVASTCTEKGDSRIEARYENSNKQKYFVPCPHCTQANDGVLDGFQVLLWERLDFKSGPAVYPCEYCNVVLTELDKPWMLENGQWRAERPEIVEVQGFWLNKLYSPFVTWVELVERYQSALAELRGGNKEVMKKFVTLDLAKTWEDRDEDLDREGLLRRCEDYQRRPGYQYPVLPDGVTVLTCSADVQEDRIELEVVGWGKGRESWQILTKTFEGDPTKGFSNEQGRRSVWNELDEFLETEFLHARGIFLPIAVTFIDSGYHANDVYSFTKPRAYRRIFACKGSSNFDHVPLGKKRKIDRANVWLFMVGSSQIKKKIYSWLRVETPGPGYMHFDKEYADANYFAQLTCEVLKKKYEHGFPKRYWEKPQGARNEAIDIRVYNYAAFLSLSENPDKMLEVLRVKLLADAKKLADERAKHEDPNQLKLLPELTNVTASENPEIPDAEKASEIAAPEHAPAAPVEKTVLASEPQQQISTPVLRRTRSPWLHRNW
jgi:phage terminase large subunit GpA-like protein